jgi:N-acetylglutamate synthase-like GNAT family acetyltransferase
MKIIDLTDQHKDLYCLCLEDWSSEIREAGDHKSRWYDMMKDKGLRVKLATDDNGTVAGMIQYAPVEHTHIQGKDLYFIYCVWVHGYKQGRGNFQKKGMGKALLAAAEEDIKSLGAKGVAAWDVGLPFWMKASWFKKYGYKKADKDGISVLMWKPFTADAVSPKWIKLKKKPEAVAGQVTISAFKDGWCPAQNMVFERAKRAASECGAGVVFNEINTHNPEILREWGILDALFIDGKAVRTGPPPKYEKIKKQIERKVKRLK